MNVGSDTGGRPRRRLGSNCLSSAPYQSVPWSCWTLTSAQLVFDADHKGLLWSTQIRFDARLFSARLLRRLLSRDLGWDLSNLSLCSQGHGVLCRDLSVLKFALTIRRLIHFFQVLKVAQDVRRVAFLAHPRSRASFEG